mmetsp:Transcript_17907/g.40962  ORF Transcript_17907/g.40962 Transcript_17907/m.40962 type:complete len:357 (+) Transcript_17907:90-1160(+)
MVGNKYAGIHFFLFGIVLTRCLVTAKVSWPAISSSTGFASRKDVLHNIYSSKTARRLVALEYIHHDNIKLTDPAIPVFSHTHQMHLRIRGGGVIKKNEPRASGPIRSSSSPQHEPQKIKNGLLLLASTTVLYFLFHTRNAWIDLFNKEKLQASVVQTLENLNSYPYLLSRSIYIISMALWETLGMSTIPVETAAAMVFGWSGFYWSGIGKVLGACLAFGLGRGALSTVVDKKLSSNTFLKLVQRSTEENPLLVVVLIKLSCFPETVKNFGSSMLKPIRWWMFVLGTVVHGLTFTALWTYLGVDTAARLKDTQGLLPPDQLLKTLLSIALINGAVVSPLSMVYWMRTLRQKQDKKEL